MAKVAAPYGLFHGHRARGFQFTSQGHEQARLATPLLSYNHIQTFLNKFDLDILQIEVANFEAPLDFGAFGVDHLIVILHILGHIFFYS